MLVESKTCLRLLRVYKQTSSQNTLWTVCVLEKNYNLKILILLIS